MMQSAALVGIWGLTLAAFFIFAAPLAIADRRTPRQSGGSVIAVAAVLLAHVGYGRQARRRPRYAARGVTIRIVQPAIPQDMRWASENAATIS
jgi:apolipoprotein N-acyltransferase